jgi:para-aminobenzoate synthetase component 1
MPLEAPLPAVAAKVCARPLSFWLDSALAHRRFGRYSFLGWDPFLVLESKNGIIKISAGGRTRATGGDPFEALRELLLLYRLPYDRSLPPLATGAVGYFGYDLCHHLERLPRKSRDDLHLPDCWLGFYDRILAYEHGRQQLLAFSTGLPAGTRRSRLRRARERLAEVRHLIKNAPGQAPTLPPDHELVPVTSNFTPAGFIKAVARAREYIFAGDIFQVNLAQRFQAPLVAPPFAVYRRLRGLNPVPFAAYLNLPEVIIASSSPERFLRLRGRRVETRPIKGTRPRGQDPAVDQALRRELWASAKDRAELAMIVDLERNDLGRVCEVGSVRVPRLYSLEAYATVFHLVATVVGTLAPGRDFVDCLKAAFPGGSITGAPKVRAMEIIDELEPVQRGIYTGSLGYISFSGRAADLNIAIRTLVIKGQTVYFHAGGGIVADSVPELEYEETLAKVKALIEAVQTARAGTWS